MRVGYMYGAYPCVCGGPKRCQNRNSNRTRHLASAATVRLGRTLARLLSCLEQLRAHHPGAWEWDTSVVTRAFAFWIRACPTCRSPHHHQSFRASDAEVRRPARRRQRRKPGSCPPAEEGGEPHVNAGALSWALEPSRLCLWLPETKLKQSEIRLPARSMLQCTEIAT